MPADSTFLLESGAAIEISSDGDWILRYKELEYCLEEMSDFFRVWLLLESPFEEVDANLKLMAENAAAKTPFPYAKLIGSTLEAKSSQWSSHAIQWLSFLENEEMKPIRKLLAEAKNAKWIDQGDRNLISKFLEK